VKKREFIWALTGISAVLGFMLTVQITSHPGASAPISTSYIDLRTQVLEQQQEHQILETEISKNESQLALYKASTGSQESLAQALTHDANTVAQEAGMTALSGPGMTITIASDPSLPFDATFAGMFEKQSDQWISLVVNDLFANGATAISINGQRLVTTSSIRLVLGLDNIGGLQVNTHPITSPYLITAIGNVSNMQATLTVNNVAQYMTLMQEDFQIKTYLAPQVVTVPAYNGPLPGLWAKEVTSQ